MNWHGGRGRRSPFLRRAVPYREELYPLPQSSSEQTRRCLYHSRVSRARRTLPGRPPPAGKLKQWSSSFRQREPTVTHSCRHQQGFPNPSNSAHRCTTHPRVRPGPPPRPDRTQAEASSRASIAHDFCASKLVAAAKRNLGKGLDRSGSRFRGGRPGSSRTCPAARRPSRAAKCLAFQARSLQMFRIPSRLPAPPALNFGPRAGGPAPPLLALPPGLRGMNQQQRRSEGPAW